MTLPITETIIGSKIILREKKLDDARDDYAWEVDPELAHLDAALPTTTTFPQFLADYTDELDNRLTNRHRWAIDTLSGKHIGNCSYYNISKMKGEAELGIMIGDRDYWSKGYGTDVITTLVNHIFCQTNLNRIYLKTLETNTRAQKCFQKCGFTPYGQSVRGGVSFMFMEVYRHQWQK